MRIIKQPGPQPVEKTCQRCGAELEIERSDCLHVMVNPSRWDVKCPCCSEWLQIASEEWGRCW